MGPDIDMKFHQEVMEIVSYDIYTNFPCFTSSITHFVIRGILTSVDGINYTFILLFPPFPL